MMIPVRLWPTHIISYYALQKSKSLGTIPDNIEGVQ